MKDLFMKLSFKKKSFIIVIFELLCLIFISISLTMILTKGSNYGFIDSRYDVNLDDITDLSTVEEENVLESNLLYSFDNGEMVDKTIKYNDNEYHIVISKDGKNIIINDKAIFNTVDQVNSIYYLDDGLIINTSSLKDKLFSLDFNGNMNIIEEQDAVILINEIKEKTIIYTIKSYNRFSDEIYLNHYINMYNIDYLGNNEFSKPRFSSRSSHYTECIKEYNNYCLLNDFDNLRIELKNPDYDSGKFITYLRINGHELSFEYFYVDEIRLLNDNYLYVSLYDTGIGYDNNVYIIDSEGDIVNDIKNFISDSMIEYSSFKNGVISFYGDLIDSVANACNGLNYNGLKPDSIVFKSIDLKYIGKGCLEVINYEEMTFSDYLKSFGYSSCDELFYAKKND